MLHFLSLECSFAKKVLEDLLSYWYHPLGITTKSHFYGIQSLILLFNPNDSFAVMTTWRLSTVNTSTSVCRYRQGVKEIWFFFNLMYQPLQLSQELKWVELKWYHQSYHILVQYMFSGRKQEMLQIII